MKNRAWTASFPGLPCPHCRPKGDWAWMVSLPGPDIWGLEYGPFTVPPARSGLLVLWSLGIATREDVTLTSIDRAALKQVHAALATLLLEAAKHDTDATVISHVLEECKFGTDRIEEFNSIFKETKESLRILLSSIGNNPPHIVDIDWRLDYYIKNNHLEKVNEPTYLISFKTEQCGQAEQDEVQFACSQEQLQDLVAKLKDACKSMERASQL